MIGIVMSLTGQFFTNNHLNENGIALVVDGLMLNRMNSLPLEIQSHVEECDTCKQQIIQVSELMRDQPIPATGKHPFFDAEKKGSSILQQYYRAAAAVLILFTGGMLYFLMFEEQQGGQRGQPQLQSSVDSTARFEKKESPYEQHLIAEHFLPSPNLDDLIQSEFRSTSVEVLTPSIGATVQPPITFRWTQVNRPVTLKILTNKEVILLTTIVSTDTFFTSKRFKPGLYYWKLEGMDELLFIGKFFVQ